MGRHRQADGADINCRFAARAKHITHISFVTNGTNCDEQLAGIDIGKREQPV